MDSMQHPKPSLFNPVRNTVLGFYQNPHTAQSVLKKFRAAGLRKVALIRQGHDRHMIMQTHAASPVFLIVSFVVAILIFLGFVFNISHLLPLTLISFFVLGAWWLIDFYYFQISSSLIEKFKPIVLKDETLVIAQVPSRHVKKALNILRQVESGHPVSFLLRGEQFTLPEKEEIVKDPLTAEEMNVRAMQLALELQDTGFKASQSPPSNPKRRISLLQQLYKSENILKKIRHNVAESEHVEQTVTTAAEWLLDNNYVIQGNIEEIYRNLPKKFYKTLPKVLHGEDAGLPRVYVVAKELVRATANKLNHDNIVAFLNSYQSVSPLTIGELWALPLMLRFRLIENFQYLALHIDRRLSEGEYASLWGNRLLNICRKDIDLLPQFLSILEKNCPRPSAHFAEELLDHLFDEESVLLPLRKWFETLFKQNTAEMVHQEQLEKSIEQVSFSSAVISLITLSQLSWQKIFETTSVPDRILGQDPASIYLNMDFNTRDRYRQALEDLAKHSRASEIQVARQVLDSAEHGNHEVQRHVGYYLIDKGRPLIEAHIQYRPSFMSRIRRFILKHPTTFYLTSVASLTLLTEVLILLFFKDTQAAWVSTFFLVLFSSILASEYVIQVLHFLINRFIPPAPLPKLEFEEALPTHYKTLLIVPTLLSSKKGIDNAINRLEIHYLANKDPSMRFGLYVDFKDSPTKEAPEDQALLNHIVQGFKTLSDQYGTDIFVLLHRPREWNASEGVWMGWERKRGKLESLNSYLCGDKDTHVSLLEGSVDSLRDVRFVITLDADTEMPKDAAKKLVATIAHPLNIPRLSQEGTIERGYTLIQPQVSTNFIQAKHSYFTYIFSDNTSIDPYSVAISNVYQDLWQEGTYHGKGIYDLHAFHEILGGRFPENQILSHDLLEGCYAKVAFASDILLLDSFPEDYPTWSTRLHRWMRGDWQIIDWLFPYVKDKDHKRAQNPLSAIDRWKIFDNLRRAVLPFSSLLVLLISWTQSLHPVFWSLFVAFLFFVPFLISTITALFKSTLKELSLSALRALIQLSVLPHQAWLSLDAFARVVYRRCISHRKLLEWPSAIRSNEANHNKFLLRMGLVSLFAILSLIIIYTNNQSALWAALPFCVLWLISPLVIYVIDHYSFTAPSEKLSFADQLFLRHIGRRTWRYFDDFVGPQSNWLPPDNYQAALQIEVAPRTSPTNIGLWMLCALSAKDLAYITADDLIDRLSSTFETLFKLEYYQGHLLNWYDIISLNPLYPRYVSTVDNGNLLACLWTLKEGIGSLAQEPLLPSSLFEGLRDTFDQLNSLETSPALKTRLNLVKGVLYSSPLNLLAITRSIAQALQMIQEILSTQKMDTAEGEYWAKKLEEQLHEWNTVILRYFSWADILNEASFVNLHAIDKSLILLKEAIFKTRFSLQMLASDDQPQELHAFLKIIDEAMDKAIEEANPLAVWKMSLNAALDQARWLAREQLSKIQALQDDIERVADMDMRFLYNTNRKLFSIGFHVDDRRMDHSYYDLLASEARIASLVSIAKGDVPQEHWWALGRSYHIVYGKNVLVSWGGTMFEYLMPLLFNHPHSESLLGTACASAVACQIIYGNKRGIPWGISESAFSDIDLRKTYQYRSFGVPGLGLKRDLEEDLVVSPYSTVLALGVDPMAAVTNMRRLARKPYQMLNSYGFYESIDFSRQKGPYGERGVVVYAYMAHHAGMSLLAINNLLNDHIIPNRFHADPRIAGVEALLCERVPKDPPISKGSRKEIPVSRLTQLPSTSILGRVDTPHSTTPKVNLLSNGAYSLMMTNSGGGYSRWKDFDITRWYADTTSDNWGSYCYLKDLTTDAVWSTGYHPTYTKGAGFSVTFKADKVELHRRDHEIQTHLEVMVSPEDDAEIRLITLANLSSRPRQIELTTYSELSLCPHAADRAHPAFNKLFIQTEKLDDLPGLLAFRKLRSPHDSPLFAGHVVAAELPSLSPLQYETNRDQFIGRGNTLIHPKALSGDLSNTEGTVLDPIFSLRYSLELAPGQRVRIAFTTLIADTKEKAIALVKRYADLAACQRVVELAWNSAQLELRHLRIHQEEVQLFQKLASRILYPQGQLRPPADQLKKNRLGQSHLWSYGISGDLPILAVTVADFHDIELVKQVLNAHAFFRLRGLKVDLVIFNEEATSYDHPLLDQLQRLVNAHSGHTDIGKPGGVFLVNYEQIKEEDLNLILAVSRANLIAARGSLRQQLVSPVEWIPYPPRLPLDQSQEEFPSPPLAFLELVDFNGLGGFTPDGREYVIYLDTNAVTPAPWINVLANPLFGTLVSESGLGSTWYANSQNNRLTPWTNDPVLNPICDAIYIRDNHLSVCWTPTPGPIREIDPYRIRHGQGYSRFEHNSHSIEQDLTIFVPVDNEGGLPLRIQRLRLKNHSPLQRDLSVFAYSEWVLGENREDTQMHIITQWDPESQALFAFNRYHPDFGDHIAFVCSIPVANSFTGNRTEFLGRNNDRGHPAALKRKGLSGTTGAAFDPCAALHLEVSLEPNEQKEVVFIMGYAKDEATARSYILRCREAHFVEQTYLATLQWWDRLLGTIQVQTPKPAINFVVNRWLLYQNLSCRYWGRSAFYQSSGAYGFRDQLQDVASLVYTAPEIARHHILRAAGRQFVEGDVQHWWHATSKGGGVRTRISDDLLWLPYVTAHYVRITQDVSILSEVIPFIKGELLKPDQHEIYFTPEVSEESGTLLEHCRRAMNKGITEGPHALPLIGGGDWNDGMNRVGIEGKGESVWLGWFLVHVMNDFADLLSFANQPGAADGFRTQAKRLAASIEEKGWDGQWYRRAYFDDGTPLGSKDNREDMIDSLPQSWAIISGAADANKAFLAMQAVEEHLIQYDEGLVLLLKPPFETSSPDPGYIQGYPPGVRENGGQYTHGSLWVPMAFARMKEAQKAVRIMQMMHPIAHTTTLTDVQKFKLEPYAVAADIYALPGQIGRGGWSWYTGSAGWMYRVWVEEIFGLTLRGNLLSINPVVPQEIMPMTIQYTFKSTPYHITINHREGSIWHIELDGKGLDKNEIALVDDGHPHTIVLK